MAPCGSPIRQQLDRAVTIPGVVTNYTGTVSTTRTGHGWPRSALWFTNAGNDSIGRITTGGQVTNYPGAGPYIGGIVSGPMGPYGSTTLDAPAYRAHHHGGEYYLYNGSGVTGVTTFTADHTDHTTDTVEQLPLVRFSSVPVVRENLGTRRPTAWASSMRPSSLTFTVT